MSKKWRKSWLLTFFLTYENMSVGNILGLFDLKKCRENGKFVASFSKGKTVYVWLSRKGLVVTEAETEAATHNASGWQVHQRRDEAKAFKVVVVV